MPIRTPLDLYRQRITLVDRRGLIQPRTTSQILDQAIRLMQLHGLKILWTSILPSCLCFISLIFYSVFIAPLIFTTKASNFQSQILEILFTVPIFFFVVTPIFVIGISFSIQVTAKLTRDYIMGDQVDDDTAVNQAFAGLPSMAWMLGVVMFRSFGLALLCIGAMVGSALLGRAFPDILAIDAIIVLITLAASVVGVLSPLILLSNYSLAPIIYNVEGTSPKESCQRSKHLLKSHGRSVPSAFSTLFSAWCLIAFVGVLMFGGFQASYAITGISGLLQTWSGASRGLSILSGTLQMLPGFFVIWLLTPFYSAVLSVLYFDRRVKIEAFDIKVLANDVLKTHRRRNL